LITDTRFTLETPEGTDLPLYPTGLWVRAIAYFLDALIRLVAIIAISMIFNHNGVGTAITLIAVFLLEWFYPVAFELFRNGQTIGKKVMKIKVINDDGTPITFATSLIRNLLRTVDFLPVMFGAGLISSVSNNRFQRLGDLAAGTVVVYCNEAMTTPNLEPVGSAPVPLDYTTDEQRVLLAFAQRCETLTPSRQKELADIIAPLLNTDDPVLKIKKMGNYIVGSN